MGKFRSNIIPTGKPRKKTPEELELLARQKLERMVILSDRARADKVKVTLPRMSWEKTE
jgi:hypothetical protein